MKDGELMYKVNPYRPGAGTSPLYLAGREIDENEVNGIFEALVNKVPVSSVIYSGLRGVGKTVLLNRFQRIAEEKSVFCKYIEVETRQDFISQIVACSQAFLREVSSKEKIKNLLSKALDALKTLVISFDVKNTTFTVSSQERELYTSTSLTQSLTDVFVYMGQTALEADTPICFFIDEIQYMKEEELGSLIAALHRTNQLGYPVMIIGAGLPKIYKMLSDEKTYTERLFRYKEIGSLNQEQTKKAVVEPAIGFGVKYTEEAIDKIYNITKGYPFFIQMLCSIVYEKTNKELIEVQDVDCSIPYFYRALDSGFFKVRYERCSLADKKFIFAMVKCGELPCTISNIATNHHKPVKSISPTRAQLINKGLVYSARYGELDFTVPEFTGFIQRQEDYNKWCSTEA